MACSKMNPGELKLQLLCRGLRIDPSCDLSRHGRPIKRTRAGLGSGVELILPDGLYVNVPIHEKFASESPFQLASSDGNFFIESESNSRVQVQLAPRPRFYDQVTSSGIEMSRVGVLQGTTLGIYPSKVCEFWEMEPRMNCRFCSTGLNVGVTEEGAKNIEDVVEVCQAARQLDQVTFVHFNTGYYSSDALDVIEPYVRSVKEATGLLIGVQCPPSRELKKYDHLKSIGVDHFSFCYELHNSECFKAICPGKEKYLGQQPFFDALEYTSQLMGKGRVSGEIIAGLEPIEDTLKAIDYITRIGAFPTVCIFRPLLGTDAENDAYPGVDEMRKVFQHLYYKLREHSILTGIAPNIRTSLVILPFESSYFREGRNLADVMYDLKLGLARFLYGFYFQYKISKTKGVKKSFPNASD